MADDLAVILSEMRQLRAEMRALTDVVCPRVDEEAPGFDVVAVLLRAIKELGDKTFSVADLFRHARDPYAHRLCAAIETAIGPNGRGPALGNLLRGAMNKRFGDLVLVRYGDDSHGAIWEVRQIAAGTMGDLVPGSPPGA